MYATRNRMRTKTLLLKTKILSTADFIRVIRVRGQWRACEDILYVLLVIYLRKNSEEEYCT